ncbi:MAG: peptidylprolyl isomerase [Cyanothece sp. SIO2G6]|nr:peptidylprolyl isomerase [Cyanothece sp. SIO2G6]
MSVPGLWQDGTWILAIHLPVAFKSYLMNFFPSSAFPTLSAAAHLMVNLRQIVTRFGSLCTLLLLLLWVDGPVAIALPSPSSAPTVSAASTIPMPSLAPAEIQLDSPSRLTPLAAADLESAGLISFLPPGNAIKDGKALLRYALPIDNKPIRKLQKEIEEISNLLRVAGARPMGSIKRNVKRANLELRRPQRILDSVPSDRQETAETLLAQLETGLANLKTDAEAADRDAIVVERDRVLELVGELETLMISGFPFEIPSEYDHLPRLLGRATVEMDTDYGTMTIIVDGYSAPITAGNFIDLVQRGFYDGLEFTRVEDFYVVQAGDPDPKGPLDGFIDPETNEERTIPLEVLVKGDKDPIYGFTMEQMGVTLNDPVLPFSAFGTLAMARPDRDVNGGSSQFFFLKFQSELTPAGINLLDGEYAVFGYIIENKQLLDKIQVGDTINALRVIEGAENLQPSA